MLCHLGKLDNDIMDNKKMGFNKTSSNHNFHR